MSGARAGQALHRARAWAIEVVEEPRPREVAAGVALLLAVLVYLPLRLTVGRQGDVDPYTRAGAGSMASSVQLKDVDPDGDLRVPTPPYIRPAGDPPHQFNPFAYKPKKTPTPRPTPPPVRVTATPPPTPPPTPTPVPEPEYTPPFTLIGLGERLGGRFAFLKSENAIHAALVGQVVAVKMPDGQEESHVVRAIGLDSVTVGPVDDDDVEADLILEEQAASGAPAASRRSGTRAGRARRR